MKAALGIAIAAVLAASAGNAWGQKDTKADKQKFEAVAANATEVRGPVALASILWAFTADCSKVGDDLRRRQCEGVKAQRLRQVAGNTFLVEGDATTFRAGDWNQKTKSVPIQVSSCISCVEPLEVDGARHFVVGNKPPQVKGGAVRGARLHGSTRAFKNEQAASAWKSEVVPRLKTELLIKVPQNPRRWRQGDAQGFQLEVVGFRVYDPCDGDVVCASPTSDRGVVDKRACGEDVVAEADADAKKPEKPEKPKKPRLPARLSSKDIRNAMKPAQVGAQKCFESYGVPGNAKVRITFSNEGAITGIDQSGDFVDTPTGDCIEKALRAVTFPKSRKPSTTVSYPFVLR